MPSFHAFCDRGNWAAASKPRPSRAPPRPGAWRRGVEGLPLAAFFEQAARGTLPEISYVVGPTELSEHPPYSPRDGAWLQDRVARAVLASPRYNRTALVISYDETGGWFDHVDPFRAPAGTPGEWLDDPWGRVGHTFVGPGSRLPLYIVSPWTRGGGVYTEHADHSSQLLFVERWQAAKGRDVRASAMAPWRRRHMGDLVAAFDFARPDYSVPELPPAPAPHRDAAGRYDGSAHCLARHRHVRPPVPYAGPGVIADLAAEVERGFKPVRGRLTEGRFLVLEMGGAALTNPGGAAVTLTPATPDHGAAAQRWVVDAVARGGHDFALRSFVDGRFVCRQGLLCRSRRAAVVFTVAFEPGRGHSLRDTAAAADGYLAARRGRPSYGPEAYWQLFSVSY